MNSHNVLFILFWVVVMLIIIHNCHRIINFVQENFDTTASNNEATASDNEATTSNNEETASNNEATTSNNEATTSNNEETASNNEATAEQNKLLIIKLKELITGINTISELGDQRQEVIIDLVNKQSISSNVDIIGTPNINVELELEIVLSSAITDNQITNFKNDLNEILKDYKCPSNSCPLASVLSSYPNIGDKWGNEVNECVKVSNSLDATCARCPPGTFVDYSNIDGVCSPCPVNQYNDKYNQLQCNSCPGAPKGSSVCESVTTETPNNSCKSNNQMKSDINLFEPTLEMDTIVSELYDGNIKKFKQNEVLKHRIRQLQNKISDYAYLEKEIYKNSL